MKSILHICVNFNNPLYYRLLKEFSHYCSKQTVIFPISNRIRSQIDIIEKTDNIEIIYIQLSAILKKIFYTYKIAKTVFRIRKIVKSRDYDIIHAHTLFSDGGVALVLNIIYGKRFIVAVRGTDFRFLKLKPWLKIVGKYILKKANRVICLSPTIREELLVAYSDKRLESKIEVIPNGIKNLFFDGDKNRNMAKGSSNRTRLLYVGSFIKQKNVCKLVSFASKYNDKYELTLVGGGGKNAENFSEIISDSDNINYMGHVNDIKELVKIYRKHDIFVMISKYETFGLVYIEAMSQGLPIIYSKGTGVDKYFGEGDVGFGVDLDNYSEEELHQFLTRILKNYSTISKRCIDIARTFKWPMIASQYNEIYNRM